MRYPASEKLEIIRLVEQSDHFQCGVSSNRSASRSRPSTPGTIASRPAAWRLWKTIGQSRVVIWKRIPDDVREKILELRLGR